MTKPEQLPFDLGHRKAYAREDFWVSSSNQDAIAWLDKWPDWPAPALVIYGPPFCGKTHLAKVWQTMVEKTAGEKKSVILDNIEHWIGDAEAEEKLFHLYNDMKEKGGFMLLTAEMPPKDWLFTLPDLKSRLLAAPAVAVLPPDDDLRAVMLNKLFSDRQMFVSQEVIAFILPRIERSFTALRDVVEKIDKKALAEKRAVTIPLVKEIL